VQDLTARNAAISRALVNFGDVPNFAALAKSLGMSEADLQDAAGGDVSQLAQENTAAGTSTEARLGSANTDAIRQIKAELNKRGLLNSGESGFQLDRQNTSFRQAQYDANQKLLDYLNQYQQGYVAAQQAKQGQLAQAYSDAANRQYDNNKSRAGDTAKLDHVDANGNPVYIGPDGSLYDASGNPYTAPEAPTAPPAGAPDTYPNPPVTQQSKLPGAFQAA
jgi:hypothetical protein